VIPFGGLQGETTMKELDPRIRIRAPLRCDGIGRLDCAEDTVSGERLAVRWLPLDANGDAAVKACEKLPTHPTLPRILQTGQVGTSAFVALDFPNGELLSAMGEERLENEKLLRLAAQLSDALATVHAQGVVHGEMSRDSVLMTTDGRAWLWDMPLVIANRLSDRRGENRLMQNLVKTAPYLSPERARGEGASQSGDVYALGAILCIAGGAPLPAAQTTLSVVHLVGAGEWAPRVPASLPEQWRSMLERMVSADAAKRPSSAEVALEFARVPSQNMLPTVPEMPAVRLPPEILQAAEALMKSQVEALRAPTREVAVNVPPEATPPASETAGETKVPVDAALAPVEAVQVPTALLPLASDPMPELNLDAAQEVQQYTLDDLSDAAPHDVVRIPTMELKAIELESKPNVPVVAPPAQHASVALTENLSVSRELVADGAVTLSEDEVRAIQADSRKVWVLFGAAAALALVTVVVLLATSPKPVVVPAPVAQPVVVPAPVAQPVVAKPAPLPVVPSQAENTWRFALAADGYLLRDRVRVIAAGKILTGFSVVRTLAMGADVCNAARAMLFSIVRAHPARAPRRWRSAS
jgi:hypothetical protein